MKAILAFYVLSISMLAGCSTQMVESQKTIENPQSEVGAPQSKQMVLVELFTSEG